ncbi:MAG: SUMF1/EgtB/PvdO family nonheme iron enzyme [Chlorobiaceae bacterium]|nr:SUMF1/EgtB/PvdO family nonheme iron enzyme [Chlorobiaceae bacterium]
MLGSPVIDSIKVGLDDTFVPLRISHTWKTDERFSRKKRAEAMQEEMRHFTPDELLRRVFPAYRLLLVIGDPGAGKTTLLKYYALCCLQKKQERLFSDAGPVRVFYLPLRELKLDDNRNYRTLPEQLSFWSAVRANNVDIEVFDGWLRNAGGAKSLVLLDGLDEISDLELRKTACKWIDNQYTGFPETFFVVTSRLTGYRKTEGVELEADHIRADVMDFTAEQQQEFLSKWFMASYCRELCPAELDPETWIAGQKLAAEERTKTIVEYLGKDENRGLRELAAVPMMLQIMAILWKEREFLPGNRVKLYSAALDYLLEYRDMRRIIAPLLPADKARLVLAPVALWMQEELEADEADCSAMHTEMQKVLGTLDHPPTAEAFCKNLVDRAGLLVEYGEERREYLFRHKTFREYLSGGQLTEKIKRNSGLIAPLVEHFGEDWWNEPITFFMAQADAAMFDKFMECLFDSEVSEEFSSKQQTLLQTVVAEAPQKTTNALNKKLLEPDTTANRQRYILDCLMSLGKEESLKDVLAFARTVLGKNKDVKDRADNLLSLLIPDIPNDDNKERFSGEHGNLDNFSHFILIPGGEYIYSQPEKKGTVVTVSDLWFAKYPVTNRQYRSFIDFLAGKPLAHKTSLSVKTYTKALHDLANSRNETIKGFDKYLKEESDLVKLFRSDRDDDRKFNKDDQPVVSVTWYSARAYCLWLSMLSGEEYRLPTEIEWEWAAGGRRDKPGKVLKVKEYPWGDKPEPSAKHANFNENEGATTPVGRYPDGATPEGLYDMAGNVWEWMEDWYDNDKSWKALRGGSWHYEPVILRCRVRYLNFPDNGINVNGFRVVRPSPKMNS